MSAYLTDFCIIRPRYEQTQDYLLNLIAEYHTKAECTQNPGSDYDQFLQTMKERLLKIGLGKDKIQKRGYSPINHAEFKNGNGLSKKMEIFDEEVATVFDALYPEGCKLPPHLIQVSCTGYVAPSGAQQLISKKNLGNEVSVTNAYHMGCYASIPAVRIAQGYLLANNEESDIVHTEMCTLHMNSYIHTTEQLMVQSLFADGFIKYTMKKKAASPSLKLLALHEAIVSDSTSSMLWKPRESGFHFSIAKEVPVLIARGVENYLSFLGKKAGVSTQKLKKAHFAIHPGGPKIIELVANALNLDSEQIKYSQEILSLYGNMSSATLPHVWEKIVNDKKIRSGSMIVSLAFGPGLTISGALFEKES